MARPYSTDLRERAVAAAQRAGRGRRTRADVAEQFAISERTLYAWLQRVRAEQPLAPKPHAGGRRPSVDAAGRELLRELVRAQNDRTLDEYIARYHARTGVWLSRPALCRVLGALKLPRKKSRSGPASRTGRT